MPQGGGVNRISSASPLTFNVKIANQGDNDEADVKVRVTIKAGNAKAVTATKTIAKTTSKAEATVPVTIASAPGGRFDGGDHRRGR